MITLIAVFVIGLALGFIGAFVVNKYENKTAAQIQNSVNDLTAKVEAQVNQVQDSQKK